MFRSKGKAGGGSSKSKSKGGRGKGIKKYRALETPSDHIVKLREALFLKDGKTDKDVTAPLQPFLKFEKGETKLSYKFVCGADFKKNKDLTKFAFETAKANLKAKYESTGYGWDDFERKSEMCDQCARFIFVFDKSDTKFEKPLGFVQFNITLQGSLIGKMTGLPCVLINDIHIMPSIRRKGVATSLLKLLSVVAVRERMSYVMIKSIKGCKEMDSLVSKKLKNFSLDDGAYITLESDEFDEHADAFVVYSRCIDKSVLKAKAEKENVQALAQKLAMQLKTKEGGK